MRFDFIEIHNYRQYRDMSMSFPKSKDTDLHVIVASNGVGKTNMLNAINWCLYGREPHLGDEHDSLTIANLAALRDAKEEGLSEVTVSVSITASVGKERNIFTRSQKVNTSSAFAMPPIFEARRILESGDTEILNSEEADAIIEEFLPLRIRQYFFFDGEQLYNYFGAGQDTTHVKDSIHQIAQITVVTGARAHLDSMISEYNKSIGKMNPEVDNLSAQLEKIKSDKANYLEQIAALQASIDESEQIVAEMNQKISGTESVVEDNERYESNVEKLKDLEKKKEELQNKLKAFVRRYYVLLQMYHINAETRQYIQEKYDKGQLPPTIDVSLLQQSINTKQCAVCHSHLNAESEQYLLEILKKHEVSSKVSHKLVEIKSDVAKAVKEAEGYQIARDSLFAEIRQVDDDISTLTAENEILYKRISTCSSVEEIALWMEKRKTNSDLIKDNSVTIGAYNNQVSQLENQISVLEKEIATAINQTNECEELKKELDFAQRARDVLAAIEQEIISDVRKQMEIETFDQFSRLIWKKDTYGRIELNANYQLRLYHKMTGDSCLGSCSAAERELLALAFTIALHRVSGHESLLFIDTPVGRVSDLNRENFAKSLIDVSRYKQLILAFTPSEFSEEISKYFNATVLSSRNLLKSDTEEETTQGV